jgi:RNA polymerase-binding transcription factor DksA
VPDISDDELQEFRRLLNELREKLANSVSNMEREALRRGDKSLGELASVPLNHLADQASDNFTQDMMVGILQNSEAELADVDTALDKIERGIYGTCEDCGGDISKDRLRALPFARLCIDCKREQEANAI